ncbi:MAG TPA: anthrone oxygenase family protein [Acidimicrobiales bacterium]|jgi:uncharacterized membrane protein|nr:anthrone oxygenase family protein [Acidimicrobiales bacterium]
MSDGVVALTFVTAVACGLGAIATTRAFHIPRHDALAVVDPDRAESGRYWSGYVTSWTAMNHVRTVVPLAASALLIGGLLAG